LNLCIDIGNSFVKIAIFNNAKEMVFFKRYVKLLVADIRKLKKKYDFSNVIISSVRKNPLSFFQHLEKNYHLIMLDHKTKIPFVNDYDTPKTLGKDRIAGVAGAHAQFPKKNVLLADIGTCMTIDFLTKKGVYKGGNISPGVKMRLQAMHEFTSQLPLVKFNNPKQLMGKTTKEALKNGAVFGISLEIESYIKRLKDEYKNINVILTGGDASFFAELIDYQIFVDQNLVLKGLNEILTTNI